MRDVSRVIDGNAATAARSQIAAGFLEIADFGARKQRVQQGFVKHYHKMALDSLKESERRHHAMREAGQMFTLADAVRQGNGGS